VADASTAELIVVNTCGFIDAAKRESIDAIVEAGRMKTDGCAQAVVAVGCMIERHRDELADALPEVDLFLGASEMEQLVPRLREKGLIGDPVTIHPGVRTYAGDSPAVRYLKISEGCDHGCAFCAIPLMRGRHRSFGLDEIVSEAQLLELQGAREVNLVAQDLAHYGRDRRDGVRLPELLEALVKETSIAWYRNLYLYSAGITPRLLEVIAAEPRILRYLDMPMQHASDAVLERMRRPERQRTIREKVARFRDAVPDLAIRTTCIVGFPGETDDDFKQLLDFLEEVQFERVGAFMYSPQEGTRAAQMDDDVPEGVKRDRLERLTEVQRSITAERYESRVGSRVRALVERSAADVAADRAAADGTAGDARGVFGAQARLPWQADDIDGVTWLDSDAPVGSFVDVEVTDVVDDYDFTARVLAVIDAPAAAPRTAHRRLPLATIGSFGR
jgi:ribosomal protein S12 methylthiotransferase